MDNESGSSEAEPLPGQSRKRRKVTTDATSITMMEIKEHGNWWEQVPVNHPIHRAVDEDKRRFLRDIISRQDQVV